MVNTVEHYSVQPVYGVSMEDPRGIRAVRAGPYVAADTSERSDSNKTEDIPGAADGL